MPGSTQDTELTSWYSDARLFGYVAAEDFLAAVAINGAQATISTVSTVLSPCPKQGKKGKEHQLQRELPIGSGI
jgi:hypothetical protein